MTVDTLGFIGLGTMGGRMCKNLAARSGKKVLGYDINAERAREIGAQGVEIVGSITELVERSDMVFMCLPGEPQVRAVAFGQGGLVNATRAGQTIVDMTTATVEISREVAAELARRGVDFADAPVARGVPSAQDGTLSIMVGASDEVFARIEPYLGCMGTDISHCGDIGTGQVVKLMNNMIVFQNVSSLAEAMAIATRAGVDRAKLFSILEKGSADSFVMRRHGSFMTSGDYPDDWFSIEYSRKDIGYALALAEQVGVDAASARIAADRLAEASKRGWGQLYSPAIYKLFEEE